MTEVCRDPSVRGLWLLPAGHAQSPAPVPAVALVAGAVGVAGWRTGAESHAVHRHPRPRLPPHRLHGRLATSAPFPPLADRKRHEQWQPEDREHASEQNRGVVRRTRERERAVRQNRAARDGSDRHDDHRHDRHPLPDIAVAFEREPVHPAHRSPFLH